MGLDRVDLTSVSELDIGCGSGGGGRVPRLIGESVNAVGVDLDVSANNPYDLLTEAGLRMRESQYRVMEADGMGLNPALDWIEAMSVYFHYPREIRNAKKGQLIRMNRHLIRQLVPASNDGDHVATEKNASREILEAEVRDHRFILDGLLSRKELPFLKGGIKKRLIEANAIELLKAIPDESLERIYADYFFNCVPPELTLEVIALCRQKLNSQGVLEIVERKSAMNMRGDQVRENGFTVSGAEKIEDVAQSGVAPRTQAVILMDQLPDIPQKKDEGHRLVVTKE